ncbi:MAG: oligopeptide transporter, OPT family [Fidelibacterota bacterium]|nr:MAG: oligopeptide transporter, OPT family [Candidatus Neomarinimicrobiota bacterium]
MKNLPEITVKAVILGVVLAVLLGAANAYLGLFAGMTVSASIPAAVISMGILRLFREHNILENNIVQTAASAGESLAAGAIFTLPALVMMGYWTNFDYLWVTLIMGLGGLIGVLFTIPLRRSLIVEGELTFPEGVATAEVLKTGESGGRGIVYIAMASIAGALFKFGELGLRVWTATIEGAARVGGSIAYIGTNLSPALISVGFIVKLNIATLVFLGGAINWFVAIPIVSSTQEWPTYQLEETQVAETPWNAFPLELQEPEEGMTAEELATLETENAALREQVGEPVGAIDWASRIWSTRTRYLGVGAMVVGGLWALLSLGGSIIVGIRTGLQQFRRGPEAAAIERTEMDTPMQFVLTALAVAIIPLFILYQAVVGHLYISLPMALIMLVAGFLFSAVAAYMAGLVGSSNNPISGVTIATILFSSLLLLGLLGRGSVAGPPAAIMIGAVVCAAAAIAGDNMQDLKAGFLVKATPWKQQVMQAIGTISAAFVMAPILMLLLTAYGFGPATPEHPNSLQAPQATLMRSVAEGVFGGNLPWDFIFIGGLVGAAVISLDQFLKSLGTGWRAPVLAVAVGIYLPLQLSVPIFIGGLISFAAEIFYRRTRQPEDVANTLRQHGLLFASGLITGEALVGIFMAIPIVIAGDSDVLAIIAEPLGGWPGLILLGAVIVWLYRVVTHTRHAT